MKKLRVEDAQSGQTFDIIIEEDDYNIAKLKLILNRFVPIIPNDQILLVGPPYNLLETQYNPNFKQESNGPRIFLFNKTTFSGNDIKDNTITNLKILPDGLLDPEPIGEATYDTNKINAQNNSPIINTIFQFERKFLLNTSRAVSFVKTTEKILENCRNSVREQIVQNEALSAAYNHLNLNYDKTKQSFEKEKEKLYQLLQKHTKLLINFEPNLLKLSEIDVLPQSLLSNIKHSDILENRNEASAVVVKGSLGLSSQVNDSTVSLQNESSEQTKSKSTNEDDAVAKLIDFIPIVKMRDWAKQCEITHNKIKDDFLYLEEIYNETCDVMNTLAIPDIDILSLNEVLNNIELSLNEQKMLIQTLREDNNFIYNVISRKLDVNDTNQSTDDIPTLTELERRRQQQEENNGVLDKMKNLCLNNFKLKDSILQNKIELTMKFGDHLKHIAAIQSNYITKLKKSSNLMKQWCKGHNEYFSHLDSIANLPKIHSEFLHELYRRNDFHIAFKQVFNDLQDKLDNLRDNEIKLRLKFIKDFGQSLPPAYFKLIPSLKDKPPYYSGTCSEIPVLPTVTSNDIMEYDNMINPNVADISDDDDFENNENFDSNLLDNANSDIDSSNEDLRNVIGIPPEKEPTISANELMLIDKNNQLTTEIEELRKQLQSISEISRSTIENQNQIIENQTIEISKYTSTLEDINKELIDKNIIIENQNQLIEEQREVIATYTTAVFESKNEINNKDYVIDSQTKIIENLKLNVSKFISIIEESEVKINQRETAYIESCENFNKLVNQVYQLQESVLRKYDNAVKSISIDNEYDFDDVLSESLSSLDYPIEYKGNEIAEDALNTIKDKFHEISRKFLKKVKILKHEIADKISYKRFEVGKLALFIKIRDNVFVAFNQGFPNHFLSTESLSVDPGDYLLGKIIFIESIEATRENNPYNITVGTNYFSVTAENVILDRR